MSDEPTTDEGRRAARIVADRIAQSLECMDGRNAEIEGGIAWALASCLAAFMCDSWITAELPADEMLSLKSLSEEILDTARRGAELRAASFKKGGE